MASCSLPIWRYDVGMRELLGNHLFGRCLFTPFSLIDLALRIVEIFVNCHSNPPLLLTFQLCVPLNQFLHNEVMLVLPLVVIIQRQRLIVDVSKRRWAKWLNWVVEDKAISLRVSSVTFLNKGKGKTGWTGLACVSIKDKFGVFYDAVKSFSLFLCSCFLFDFSISFRNWITPANILFQGLMVSFQRNADFDSSSDTCTVFRVLFEPL